MYLFHLHAALFSSAFAQRVINSFVLNTLSGVYPCGVTSRPTHVSVRITEWGRNTFLTCVWKIYRNKNRNSTRLRFLLVVVLTYLQDCSFIYNRDSPLETSMFLYVCMCVCARAFVCIRTCICAGLHMCMYVFVYVRRRGRVIVQTCLRAYVFTCVHVHVHAYTRARVPVI